MLDEIHFAALTDTIERQARRHDPGDGVSCFTYVITGLEARERQMMGDELHRRITCWRFEIVDPAEMPGVGYFRPDGTVVGADPPDPAGGWAILGTES